MKNKSNLFKLTGKAQHYQWGGSDFIPALLNFPNGDGKPFAEYWLGAHVNSPSEIDGSEKIHLDKFIAQDQSVLGTKVQKQFGRLPYLLKVLDVKEMLSIQVHPSRNAAAFEFNRENERGIPVNDHRRNYKDDNHKPELMLALSDFWLLHGFKPEAAMLETINTVPEFHFMLDLFRDGGYEDLYRNIMELNQEQIREILAPLLDRIIPLYQKNLLVKADANFWAARAAITYNKEGNIDAGIFSVYLLNLVNLKEGEAIFQDAGILHAYLEGQNMEIMANSDNVLRGGLTPKHIDVGELMKHVSFHAVHPQVIRGTMVNDFEEAYITPAEDFQLNRIQVPSGKTAFVSCETAEIFLVYGGSVELTEANGNPVKLGKGESAVAFAGAAIGISAIEKSVIFRASVPTGKGNN
jgi:mannose-6-phosphate isomerase